MAITQNLLLYYKPSCPFCQKVLRFMEDAGVEIPLANIHDEEHLNTLIDLAGKKQVPCLVIDGKPMHESDDIIVWIRQHLTDGKADLPEDNDIPMACPIR